MTLDPVHADIARIALAGGAAMLAHRLIDRPTRDLDLFTRSRPTFPPRRTTCGPN